jgi:hypothetical protein
MQLGPSEVIAAVDRHVDAAALANESHESRGIFISEMAAVIGLAKELNLDLFIESGRARGFSTYILAKYLGTQGVEIHSFERRRDDDAIYAETRLAGTPNLTLHYGDACTAIPALLRRNAGRRIGILLDGPKGRMALELLSECCMRSNVLVGFIHDMRRREAGAPAKSRLLCEAYFPRAFYTDADEYVARYRHMDQLMLDSHDSWRPHHKGDQHVGSYGPTLAVMAFSEDDRRAASNRTMNVKLRLRAQWTFDRLRDRWGAKTVRPISDLV